MPQSGESVLGGDQQQIVSALQANSGDLVVQDVTTTANCQDKCADALTKIDFIECSTYKPDVSTDARLDEELSLRGNLGV